MSKTDTKTDRVERLLVLLLMQSMKGSSQAEKVLQLNIAGFSNFQIAEFLQTTPAVVATLLYQSKKRSKSIKRK
jgi:DNA-binding CsgD family transcriptional regulator